tara:strand:- start:94 stop:393 length:300 start_codon:yes stop_codon:yes gene_type:complete
MQIKLTKDTMIAGVPTNSGTIIEVEDHVARLLINSNKGIAVIEPCETKPVTKKVEEVKESVNLTEMTKSQLVEYATSIGLSLDMSLNKQTLITQIEEST